MLGATPDPRFHPKVVRITPLAVAVVAAALAALAKCPISGY